MNAQADIDKEAFFLIFDKRIFKAKPTFNN